MSSTMLHPHADGEDDSVATYHTARTSSFHSVANTIDAFLEEKANKNDDEVTMRDSVVGGNSTILFSSNFLNRFTSRVHERVTYDEQDGSLRMQHYLRQKMLRQLHQSENGDTYLVELKHNKARALYAIKMIRKDHCRKLRERRVLKSLSHPFLPTVYADVDSVDFSFLVMDFCPGGDLRSLLRRRPLREEAAKFYAAEVLLAMEYLQEQGIIYRGLKPENVLIRANGHIMLSGFDHAMWRPLLQTTSCFGGVVEHMIGFEESVECEEGSERDHAAKGKEHVAATDDWYMYGIFLYELLFGTTPLKAHDDRTTCINVFATQQLKFPQEPMVSPAARDLLMRLLKRNPKRRLGHKGGATKVKQHAFFQGINFELMPTMAAGCMRTPELPIKF